MQETVQDIAQENVLEIAQEPVQETVQETMQDTEKDTIRGRTRTWLHKKKKQRCCRSWGITGKNMGGTQDTTLSSTSRGPTRWTPLSRLEPVPEPVPEPVQESAQESAPDTAPKIAQDTVPQTAQENAQDTTQETTMQETMQDTEKDTIRGRTRTWLHKKKKQRCCRSMGITGKNMGGTQNMNLRSTPRGPTRRMPRSATRRGQEPMQQNMQGNMQESTQDIVPETAQESAHTARRHTRSKAICLCRAPRTWCQAHHWIFCDYLLRFLNHFEATVSWQCENWQFLAYRNCRGTF